MVIKGYLFLGLFLGSLVSVNTLEASKKSSPEASCADLVGHLQDFESLPSGFKNGALIITLMGESRGFKSGLIQFLRKHHSSSEELRGDMKAADLFFEIVDFFKARQTEKNFRSISVTLDDVLKALFAEYTRLLVVIEGEEALKVANLNEFRRPSLLERAFKNIFESPGATSFEEVLEGAWSSEEPKNFRPRTLAMTGNLSDAQAREPNIIQVVPTIQYSLEWISNELKDQENIIFLLKASNLFRALVVRFIERTKTARVEKHFDESDIYVELIRALENVRGDGRRLTAERKLTNLIRALNQVRDSERKRLQRVHEEPELKVAVAQRIQDFMSLFEGTKGGRTMIDRLLVEDKTTEAKVVGAAVGPEIASMGPLATALRGGRGIVAVSPLQLKGLIPFDELAMPPEERSQSWSIVDDTETWRLEFLLVLFDLERRVDALDRTFRKFVGEVKFKTEARSEATVERAEKRARQLIGLSSYEAAGDLVLSIVRLADRLFKSWNDGGRSREELQKLQSLCLAAVFPFLSHIEAQAEFDYYFKQLPGRKQAAYREARSRFQRIIEIEVAP